MTPDDQARHDLHSLRRVAARMRSIPSGDDDGAVRERMALRAEWNNMVGWIARVESLAQAGRLDAVTVEELGHVARELTDLLPTMERHRYHLPDREALRRASSHAAARSA